MSRKPKRKSDLNSASDVLQSLIGDVQSPLGNSFQRYKLSRKWPEIVGEAISENSKPVSFYKGILYVWAKNSAWLHQLNYMKDHIRDKVNSHVGHEWTSEVRFKLDQRP